MPTVSHPLIENSLFEKRLQPCILVIFGATGDLTARKLMPALYQLTKGKQLPSRFACVAFARRKKSHETFREEVKSSIEKYGRDKEVDLSAWSSFSERLYYHQCEFDDSKGYSDLKVFLQRLDEKLGTKGNRLYYLATQPSFFPIILENLHKSSLIYEQNKSKVQWSRVVFEKPFGHSIESAKELQGIVDLYLDESQIFRIDHYLGKETVQNLLYLRFTNPIFESIWNHRYIENIQITVGESIGIGSRGRFWEEAGMLRDVVQNHLMQLLTLIAMEPPTSLESNAIRDEKVKVLSCIRPFSSETLDSHAIRGQYGPGYIDGKAVCGYRQEDLVNPKSSVETYVALKLFIDNWRWTGTPFYVRAGKRLPKRATEITITFKPGPGLLFQQEHSPEHANCLVIRIQPNEGVSLKINSKAPGALNIMQAVNMDFRYGTYFGYEPPEAYERLIYDAIAGDSTLFARSDEVMYSWSLLTPILHHWWNTPARDFPNYSSGTWGPKESEVLLSKNTHRWRLI